MARLVSMPRISRRSTSRLDRARLRQTSSRELLFEKPKIRFLRSVCKGHKFYKDGVKAGGGDNGKPGLRADYSPTYYAAFLTDPDGNNVEAVCLK